MIVRRLLLVVSLASASLWYPSKLEAVSPFVSIGDSIKIFFEGRTQFRYESNLFYQEEQEVADTILHFVPGFDITIGTPDSGWNFILSLKEEFKHYLDNNNLDNNNSITKLNAAYKSPFVSADFGLSYTELDQTTPDIAPESSSGRLIERKVSTARVHLEYDYSEKTLLSLGADFSRTSYVNDGVNLHDRQSISLPINLYYHYSPKLDFSIGYRFRTTQIEDNSFGKAGSDSKDHFLNIGFRGELHPQIEGALKIGIQKRNNRDKDSTAIAFDGDLYWHMSEKTYLNTAIDRDFDTGGSGASLKRTSFGISLGHNYSEQIMGKIGLLYKNKDYNDTLGRHDDFFQLDSAIGYIIDQHTSLKLSYGYQKNDSENDSDNEASFKNHYIDLTLDMRY